MCFIQLETTATWNLSHETSFFRVRGVLISKVASYRVMKMLFRELIAFKFVPKCYCGYSHWKKPQLRKFCMEAVSI